MNLADAFEIEHARFGFIQEGNFNSQGLTRTDHGAVSHGSHFAKHMAGEGRVPALKKPPRRVDHRFKHHHPRKHRKLWKMVFKIIIRVRHLFARDDAIRGFLQNGVNELNPHG